MVRGKEVLNRVLVHNLVDLQVDHAGEVNDSFRKFVTQEAAIEIIVVNFRKGISLICDAHSFLQIL
jgi:hypothetical protein